MRNIINRKSLMSFILYIFFTLFMVLVIFLKKNFHVDEILTYQLANSTNYLGLTEGQIYLPSANAWTEHIAVSKNENFNYKNVWNNQAADVHPPLYYAVLHTICSLSQGRFSVWQAGIINIIFALLTLWSVRCLIFELTQSNNAVTCGSIFFMLSAGVLSAVSFFRMYVVVMFEAAFITLLFMKAVSKKCTMKIYPAIMAIAVMGALTHYYFILYLFFLCFLHGTYLLINKKFKETGIFAITMLGAGGISVLVFPFMIQQMFLREGRQKSVTMENLLQNSVFIYGKRLENFYSFINEQLFGGILTYLIVTAFILVMWKMVNQYDVNKPEEDIKIIGGLKIKWVLAVVPSICYILVISKIAVWTADRYVFPVYALLITGITSLMYLCFRRFMTGRKFYVLFSIFIAVMLIKSWKLCEWQYLYLDSVDLLEKAEQYSEEDNVFIYDINWKIAPSYCEISKYKSVTFFHKNNMELLNDSSVRNNVSLVVTVIDSCGAEAILNKVMEICPLLDSYEKIGSFGYATSYYLYSRNCSINKYRIYDYTHKKLLGCSNKASAAENVCVTVHDSVIQEVAYEDTGYVNLWMDDWVLDIKNGAFSDGTNIWLWKHNGLGAQDWIKQLNNDGTVTFVFRDDRFALTRNDEGNVYLGIRKNNDTSQKWWLEVVK